MKTIIAGTRTCPQKHVLAALEACPWTSEISLVLCGGAKGADHWGQEWAVSTDRLVEYFPAEWMRHGKKAGPIRNREMAEAAEALILVWDGKSKGSANMKREAERMGLKIWEHVYED